MSSMVIGDLGRWIENIAFGAFLLVNFGALFVALWWGLGKDEASPAAAEPWQDKGEMTADGLVFVRRPAAIAEEEPVELVESSRI